MAVGRRAAGPGALGLGFVFDIGMRAPSNVKYGFI